MRVIDAERYREAEQAKALAHAAAAGWGCGRQLGSESVRSKGSLPGFRLAVAGHADRDGDIIAGRRKAGNGPCKARQQAGAPNNTTLRSSRGFVVETTPTQFVERMFTT